MKLKLYFEIAIRIVLLFSTGIATSFITPKLRNWFGDTICDHQPYAHDFVSQGDYHWGAAHHWYFWMMLLLFILSVISLIVTVVELVNKYYPGKIKP